MPLFSLSVVVTAALVLLVGAGLVYLMLFRRAPVTSVLPITSLAVLPLENFSGNKDDEFLADGITEELTTDLAKIGSLSVTSRTSVMQYKGAHKPLPEIVRALHVDALVEGSVQRSGDRVKVTAQLIQGGTDKHLWAETYERDMRDILALESDLARTIAREIRAKVSDQELTRMAGKQAVNPQAHEAYLRGVYSDDMDKSLAYYERANQLDPDYAPPYAARANIYHAFGMMGWRPPQEVASNMRDGALTALKKDDNLADGHATLALTKLHYEWDFAGADQEFRRALELNPNSADNHHMYAHYLMAMDRGDESVAESKRAVELNPFDDYLTACLGWHKLYARQYDQARDQALKALKMEPDHFWAHTVLAVRGNSPETCDLENVSVVYTAWPWGRGRNGSGRKICGWSVARWWAHRRMPFTIG